MPANNIEDRDEKLQESFSRVLYLAENDKRLGLLLGPPDCGKSECLRQIEQQMNERGHRTILLDLTSETDVASKLLEKICSRQCFDDSPGSKWKRLTDHLLQIPQSNDSVDKTPILFLDHLDRYDQHVIQEIVRLIRFHDVHRISRLFIACANSEYLFSLDARLLDRIDMKLVL